MKQLAISEIESRLAERKAGFRSACGEKTNTAGETAEEKTGFRLFYTEEIDSTNEWAKREADAGYSGEGVFFADRQVRGKGRRGRVWQTPDGVNIAMSILLRLKVAPAHASLLTLIAGMAAAEGIYEVSGLPVGIKWPNDIVCNGKKLCGILTELSPALDYVVIGIGINVNTPSFPDELRDIASSMLLEYQREQAEQRKQADQTGQIIHTDYAVRESCLSADGFSREAAAAAVINAFFRYYHVFCRTEDLSELRREYEKRMVSLGGTVRIMDEKNPYTGMAEGITDTGALIVRLPDGSRREVIAGEVSVRGIYGYV